MAVHSLAVRTPTEHTHVSGNQLVTGGNFKGQLTLKGPPAFSISGALNHNIFGIKSGDTAVVFIDSPRPFILSGNYISLNRDSTFFYCCSTRRIPALSNCYRSTDRLRRIGPCVVQPCM